MATPEQFAANRANAQLSTGPRSVEGKAATCFNRLKHGIYAESEVIPGEDPADLAQLAEQFYEDLCPVGALEEACVQAATRNEWLKRRYARIEAQLYFSIAKSMDDPDVTMGDVALKDAAGCNALGKVQHRKQAAVRGFDKSVAELERLQQSRAAAGPHSAGPVRVVQPAAPKPSETAAPSQPGSEPKPEFKPYKNGTTPPGLEPGAIWLGTEPASWRL